MVVRLGVLEVGPGRCGSQVERLQARHTLEGMTTVCTERGNVSVSIGVLENASS